MHTLYTYTHYLPIHLYTRTLIYIYTCTNIQHILYSYSYIRVHLYIGMIEEAAGTRMFETKKQVAIKTIEKNN